MKKNMSKMKLFSDLVLMWTYTLATYHFGKVASLKLQNKRRYLEGILLELLRKPDRSTKRIHPNCAAQPLLAIVGICFEYRLAEDSKSMPSLENKVMARLCGTCQGCVMGGC